MTRFDCEDCGEIKEYVGCKVEQKGRELKFTQPVLLQSFVDPTKAFNTLAAVGTMLKKAADVDVLKGAELTKYRLGVGKLMYLMQYSRPRYTMQYATWPDT